MSRSRYTILEPQAPHFMICTIVNWIALFQEPLLAQIILDSWNFLQSQNRIRLGTGFHRRRYSYFSSH
ncbi:hypothetical protein WDW89_22970 [Deltaproteobacteria bacterium TL4]